MAGAYSASVIREGERLIAKLTAQGKEPVMVYSDQLMLLREFQTRYDALWERGAGAIGSRVNVISILKDVAGRMEKERNEEVVL